MDIKQSYIRNFLRVIAGLVLLIYLYDIAVNKIKKGQIYLDANDGYVIFGCIAILIAIEAVRAYVLRKMVKDNE